MTYAKPLRWLAREQCNTIPSEQTITENAEGDSSARTTGPTPSNGVRDGSSTNPSLARTVPQSASVASSQVMITEFHDRCIARELLPNSAVAVVCCPIIEDPNEVTKVVANWGEQHVRRGHDGDRWHVGVEAVCKNPGPLARTCGMGQWAVLRCVEESTVCMRMGQKKTGFPDFKLNCSNNKFTSSDGVAYFESTRLEQ